ncbi:Arylsulphatase [Aaosphaeria arxii CBS 175.79]|uniref:Arylsulfatase n=1 Tax=Aaosphaeria arxii CBS 175.79 TaxID=1450172 RepID=A0A6A5XMW2_9PLEO|nr:Arylsulphatase [Aaosphaeria arxii CBS 175.79]KAF2014187.1 Arylsulphatase [Aaosphaeria arxii CBS 175.79]
MFVTSVCTTLLLLALGATAKKPNILFILTDDQDWHMQSLEHMPFLQKYLVQEGTLYTNHYCTVAICCPSRVNLWTGRAAHNTNVTDVFPPYGGYPKIVHEGINSNYLPIWMQDSGYNTYYTGKLWNAHTVDNYNAPYAGGYNGSDFILDPYTYEYYNAWMSRNGQAPVSYKGQYSPDITAEKAYGFLEEATQHKEPWFLTVAPIAPHSNVKLEPIDAVDMDAPKYAKRHAHLFKDYRIPRDANFNPEKQGGVAWVKTLPRLNDTVIEYNDEFQRSRLRALQSVDEMIEKLIKTLEEKNLLEDTYIFFTTDNGYHISQHRMHPGKECGFDTDIHIPLIIRGPGIARNRISDAVTSHTDLSPTILKLAGQTREDFDGTPIPVYEQEVLAANNNRNSRHEHVNIEFWGMAIPEGQYAHYDGGPSDGNGLYKDATRNNTYKGLRLIGEDYSIYYSVWCTGDREYYDVALDPGQLDNYFDAEAEATRRGYSIAGRSFEEVVNRLDALMLVLKSCKGRDCVEPWSVLHPGGNVKTLKDALAKTFDAFYEEQPKVSFDSCELGYIKELEGPQIPNVYDDGEERLELRGQPSFKYQGHWSLFT